MVSKREKSGVGIQIRDARKDHFWTQADLARRAELSRNMIGRYERGKDVPTLETLPRLLAALGYPLQVGEFTISVTQNGAAQQPSEPKQYRLDFDQEYTCKAGPDTSLRIRPNRDGLLITAERAKRA